MVSSESCQEIIDTLTNQKIRHFKSGTQTLKETTLADGTRVIELVTPRNISETTRKTIQLQQQQRCKQYRSPRFPIQARTQPSRAVRAA